MDVLRNTYLSGMRVTFEYCVNCTSPLNLAYFWYCFQEAPVNFLAFFLTVRDLLWMTQVTLFFFFVFIHVSILERKSKIRNLMYKDAYQLHSDEGYINAMEMFNQNFSSFFIYGYISSPQILNPN